MGPQPRKGVASRISNSDRAAKKQPENITAATHNASKLTTEKQQRILDVFVQAFDCVNQESDLKAVLQEIKGHLFRRDFQQAFGKREYLEAYAARWSAARALAYADIFIYENRHDWFKTSTSESEDGQGFRENARKSSEKAQNSHVKDDETDLPLPHEMHAIEVACIGGGAGAEVVALATMLSERTSQMRMNIRAIDIADWKEPLHKLHAALTTAPSLSVYASQLVREKNTAFIDTDRLSVQFLHLDILKSESLSDHDVKKLKASGGDEDDLNLHKPSNEAALDHEDMFARVDLVTIMFTLNELFSTSVPRTTSFLLRLTGEMRAGSHLVVVDSPGSYSEVKLGKANEAKRYPMKWLLDHTLLKVTGGGQWKKIEEEDSLWFRLGDRGRQVKYPIELENCRYQLHAYQKL